MNGSLRRLGVALLVTLVGAQVGCATNGSVPGGSAQADPRLQQQASFFSKSGFQACGAGVLLGFLGSKLGKGSDRQAAVTGAAACGALMGANYYLEGRRTQYANKEQQLQAMLADLRDDNAQLSGLLAATRRVVAEDKAKIDRVNTALVARKIDKAQAEKQLAGVDANRRQLEKSLADAEQRRNNWRQIASTERSSGTDTSQLDAELARLDQQVADLRGQLAEINNYRSIAVLG